MANYLTYEQATTLMTAIAARFTELAAAFVPKGSIAFASLPATLTSANRGWFYNITDEFTTDSRFVEGTGKTYPAGTNVYVIVQGAAGSETYLFDVIGNYIDLDSIYASITAVSAAIAPEFDATTAYAVGAIVTHNGTLYKFTSAHAAGAWDDNDVTSTTVTSLVDEAEPAPLTSAQVTALTGLLD